MLLMAREWSGAASPVANRPGGDLWGDEEGRGSHRKHCCDNDDHTPPQAPESSRHPFLSNTLIIFFFPTLS